MKDPKKTMLFPPPHFSLIGHRGAAGLAPENTAASFKMAKNLGINWVEFDTQCCKTGEWVIFHDDTLERTTGKKGRLHDTALKDLEKLEVGSFFAPQFKGERILLLKEALHLLISLELHANIEIKGDYTEDPDLLRGFISILSQDWPKTLPPPLVSSFHLETVKFLKSNGLEVPYGYIIEEFKPDALEVVKKEDFFSLHCDYISLSAEDLKWLKKQQVPVLLYTVNDYETKVRLLNEGISAIFTDYPNLLIKD